MSGDPLYDHLENMKQPRVFRDAYHELDEVRHERDALITALHECVVALRSANFFMKDYLKTVTHPGVSRLTGDCDDAIDRATSALERYKHEHP